MLESLTSCGAQSLAMRTGDFPELPVLADWPLSVVCVIGFLQAFLIVSLMVNRAKLRQRDKEAALLADISSKFVNLAAHEVDDAITDAQRRLCELLDVDFIVLWQWSDKNEGHFIATHSYSLQDGVQPTFERRDDAYPWVRAEAIAGRPIILRSLDEIPHEGDKDRESARQAGIKSNLTLPLAVGGDPAHGIITFNTTRNERGWSGSLVKRMQLVAEIFANALARKRADESRRENELRLSLAMDSAEAGLWVLDCDTQTFLVNAKARTIFGYPPDDPLTMARFEASVHPEDSKLVEDSIRGAVESGRPVHIEYRIRRGDGSERWIISRGRPFCNSAGVTERVLGLSMDITHRKIAESRLHQMSQVVDQSPVLVVITDKSGVIVYVNRKFTEVTGYSSDECIGKTPSILKSGNYSSAVYKELWSTILRGKTWSGELHNRKKSGELYWERAIISPLLVGDKNITHFIGIKEDITDEKRALEELRSSEELNRVTFEQAAIGVAHIAIDGRWLRVNDRVCDILGYSNDELLSLSVWDVTFSDDRDEHELLESRMLAGDLDSYSIEKRYARKDGTEVWADLNVSLLRDTTGKPMHSIAVVEDASERRRAEMEAQELRDNLAHAGRVTLLGQLASALAHELSQPLGAILRNAEAAEIMLQGTAPDMDELRAIVDDIQRDDERAGMVIDRLRSLLKRRSIDTQPISMSDVVDEVTSLLQADAAARHVVISCDSTPDLPVVMGDRIHLQQVLLNLLVNAMDAMDGCPHDHRRICVALSQPDPGKVEVRISDQGEGIPPESFDRLFEPFFTSKSTGMGMGLPVSRTIINAHHGEIWAENTPEGGACFCFTVPVGFSDTPDEF